MSSYTKRQGRETEIVMFFYTIFGNRVHSGMIPDDARKEAYDAVALRYGISKGRLLNIISEQKTSRIVNNRAFVQNARLLIAELVTANEEIDSVKDRNSKLIKLLEECINGNDK